MGVVTFGVGAVVGNCLHILKLTIFMSIVLAIPLVMVFGQGMISTAGIWVITLGALTLNTGYMFYLGATRFYVRY